MRLTFLFAILWTSFSFSQIDTTFNLSPNGVFETVFDQYGNKYDLNEIRVDTTLDLQGEQKNIIICNSTANNYFELYFEVGSDMENTIDPIHNARRDVICQLFEDLSQFIVPVDQNNKVKIWIRDIDEILGSGIGQNSQVLGIASSYYVLPTNAPNISGIADGEIWKTINTGQDSYTNVATPLTGGAFYHGYIALNFKNPLFQHFWHTDLSTETDADKYDLYSVALHEITHALGFTSLIDANGDSKFAPDYNYYTRYDLFLETNNGDELITNNGICTMYDYEFNSLLSSSILSPSTTNCPDHIYFAGNINQAVYTPSTYVQESSLSHFEDLCSQPMTYPDDEYYVMSNSNNTGPAYMKRYLKPEEKGVLCELGYQLNATYGNNLYIENSTTYTSGTCPGAQVAGINDGIQNGSFIHVAYLGAGPITIDNILDNDYPNLVVDLDIDCVEEIYGLGTIGNVTSSSFEFTPLATGLTLVRYVPVNTITNERGNITYVYVMVLENNSNCEYDVCNMIPNGDFEEVSTYCGYMTSTSNYLECWKVSNSSPDLFGTFCSDQNFNIPNSSLNIPPMDVWNTGVYQGMGQSPNNHFIGFWSDPSPTGESIQTTLSTGLVNGETYRLRFWARVANNHVVNSSAPFVFSIGVSEFPIISALNNFNTNDPLIELIAPQIIVDNNDAWNYVELTFTYTGVSGWSNFIIGADGDLQNTQNFWKYAMIDDISLELEDNLPVLVVPTPLCGNQIIQDLNIYVNTPGGVFEGDGVELNGNVYSFDPSMAGPGTHLISYTINNNGCELSTYQYIEVFSDNISLSVSASDYNICSGEQSILSANGADTYNWSPNLYLNQTTGSSVITTPTSTITYIVTGTNSVGCVESEEIVINVGDLDLVLSASSNDVCIGDLSTLTATGADFYIWSPSTFLNQTTGATVESTPTGSITYTVTGTNSSGCSATANISLQVYDVNLVLNTDADVVCPGETVTITASGASSYTWSPSTYLNTTSGSTVQSTSNSTITYTVTGTNNVGCQDVQNVTIEVLDANNACCEIPDIIIPDGSLSSSINIPNNSFVEVQGLFIIDNNNFYQGCTFRMVPNAKIEILDGVSMETNGCEFFSCSKMWDGIYINPLANLTMFKSRVEDATYGVYSVGGGDYEIQSCSFNKNNIGLYIDNFDQAHTGLVWDTDFECTSNNSLTLGNQLKEPMLGDKSHFGIYCVNNSDITLGVSSVNPSTINTFDDIEVGIYTRNTTANIYRNNFINIHQPITALGKEGTPSIGWPIWAQGSVVYIGDQAGTSHENTFEDCTHGIFLDGKCSFEIRKNKFDNITSPNYLSQYSKCIFARLNFAGNTGAHGIIEDNEFDEFEAGIFCFKNDLASMNIERNSFANFDTEKGTAIYLLQNFDFPTMIRKNLINPTMNHSGRYGIRVQTAVESSSSVTIEQNTIKNVRHGIWTTNYEGLNIQDQNDSHTSIGNADAGIYYPNNPPANFSVGIKTENCPSATIYNNLIEKAMPQPTAAMNDYLFGISVETNGMGSTVQENIMRRLGKGLYFYGQPNFNVDVSCNGMYVSRTGLTFDNTFIGDQGQPNPNGEAQDNQWSIPNGGFGVQRLGTSPSTTWYSRENSLPFFPYSFQMDPSATALNYGNAFGAPYNCSFGCVNPPCLLPNIEHAIKKNAPFDQIPPIEKKMVDLEMFKVLKKNPSYLTTGQSSDTTFQQFVDSVENTNTGNIYRFNEKIALGDTLGAKDEIDIMSPSYIAETNHKIVKDIYWRTWLKNIEAFTPQDSVALYQVAIQRPHEGGLAVYDARVMLKLDINDFSDASTKSSFNSYVFYESDITLKVFPNPASTYVEFKLEGTDAKVQEAYILDMSGRHINVRLTDENRLDFGSLANGFYTLRVLLEDGEHHSTTFVVN